MSLVRKGRAQNFLDPEHVQTILGWVQAFEVVKDRVQVVTAEEIADENWTLNIACDVLPSIGEDIPLLPKAIADFKAVLARVREAENRLRQVMLEKGGFEAEQGMIDNLQDVLYDVLYDIYGCSRGEIWPDIP